MNEIVDTIEGNKLIAEFMNLYKPDTKYPFGNPCSHVNYAAPKYHSSWDWLMPVVEKIEKEHDMYIRIERDWVFICRFNDYSGEVVKTNTFTHGLGKIHGVWQAVIQFIAWYNQNNHK